MATDTFSGPRNITTDIVIFTIENEGLKVLLIKRANEPFLGNWALPGGFLSEKEGSRNAALRVLEEKTGLREVSWPRLTGTRNSVVKNIYLEQLYTFDASGRDPRGMVCTITYFALVLREKIKFKEGGKIQTPSFFSVNKLPKLAFDHKEIINYALKRLRLKLEYTNVIYSLLPSEFTFNQLQSAYEVILGKKLDKRNFRKKFFQLGLIKSIDKTYAGTRQRPAQLFKFVSKKPAELKKFF